MLNYLVVVTRSSLSVDSVRCNGRSMLKNMIHYRKDRQAYLCLNIIIISLLV